MLCERKTIEPGARFTKITVIIIIFENRNRKRWFFFFKKISTNAFTWCQATKPHQSVKKLLDAEAKAMIFKYKRPAILCFATTRKQQQHEMLFISKKTVRR